MYALIGNHCKDSLYYLNVHCIANANIDSFVDDISNWTLDMLSLCHHKNKNFAKKIIVTIVLTCGYSNIGKTNILHIQ